MKKGSIKPLGDRVLLKPNIIEEKTAAGIYRADAGEQKSQTGEVIAVGTDDAIAVEIGQNVLYKQYGGEEVEHDGVKYIVVANEDLLAII